MKVDQSGAAAAQIRSGFERAASELPVEGLVEFFSRANAGMELFKAAQALEEAAFDKSCERPSGLKSLEAKVIVGLLSDYGGVRRSEILGSSEAQNEQKPDGSAPQGSLPI